MTLAAELPFLDGPLPAAFRRRLVVLHPGRPRPYDGTEWRDALVVVERGRLDLHCRRGGVRSFPAGAVLHLDGLALRALTCTEPTVLVAVHRRDPVAHRIVELPDRPYLGVQRACTPDGMSVVADRIPELVRHVLGAGAALAGAPFLRYLVIGPAGDLVVAAGLPVDDPAPLVDGEMTAGVLPAGRYAVARHVGHLDGLAAAVDALLAWVDERGLRPDVELGPGGEHWGCRSEHFLTDPRQEPDPDRHETELALRLAH